MDSPLLSYIDVRHPNFLPPNLTVGKARDFGPWIVRAESLVPMRDNSVNSVFHNRIVYRLVEQPQAQVHLVEQEAVELVSFFEVDTDQGKDKMVVKQSITLDPFLLGARPATQ